MAKVTPSGKTFTFTVQVSRGHSRDWLRVWLPEPEFRSLSANKSHGLHPSHPCPALWKLFTDAMSIIEEQATQEEAA